MFNEATVSSGHQFFTLHHQLASNSALNSVTAFSSKVHICAEWWWQWVQLASNGTLYQSAKGYDFKSVAEILTVKKTSETLNPSHKDSVKKALDLKEAEAETIFKELISEESMDEHNSSLIQFHIRLLALIVSNSKKESPSFSTKNETNSWLKHLEDLIMQSYHLNDFPVDWFQEGISGYYKLDLCKKFKLMTLLCDEALNTQKLRSYIQDENSRHAKVVKETKLKIAAAKEKIKCLAQKLQNENAKVSSIPGEEHDAHIKIRTEVDEAHIEMLRLKSTDKSGCDATRINPEFVDNNGMTFWKLQSYNDESVLLLQVF
ncbi:hypothetical protein VIGAN_11119500 [Vigna angularis var. angularis]|uniref:WHIM1 domain-containing protein n=1 Tax=Vigna angularis var. angularis TaxID=157739 RepID=A0A0S3TA61_PHAAN|nr:uncharacterized protein LOC128193442 isoform X2 [Vigna angularis]BAU01860.1 hypothetical protein VIGAN_11119500 [Vigna angularis var. angularis]